MTCGIYQIVNTVNGKRYVGSSVDIDKRWREHIRLLKASKHHSRHLQSAWNKYGEDSFEFDVIEECEPHHLVDREQSHIDNLSHYNCSPTAGSSLGVKHSAETRMRMSEARKKWCLENPEDLAQHMSVRSRSKPKSEEFKEAVSNSLSGVPKSERHKMSMAIARAKLDSGKVLMVRLLRFAGLTLDEIALRCSVSRGQCQNICEGKRYQWVYNYEGPVPYAKSRMKKKSSKAPN